MSGRVANLILLAVSAAIISVASGAADATKKCPQGETYACDWRCKEDCDKAACELVRTPCEEGCFCDGLPNMVRINGQCVPREKCPHKVCADNEEWTWGNACSERCFETGACTKELWLGCFCKKGFVRIDGKCVPIEHCHDCPEDMEYTCGNPCSQQCPSTDIYCPQDQCEWGCYCKDGLVLINGKCVRAEDNCDETPCCRDDQEFRWANNCTQDCHWNHQICDTRLRWGCFCPEGQVEMNGRCVPVDECPPECPEDQYFEECVDIFYYLCPHSEYCQKRPQNICVRGCLCHDESHFPVNGVCKPRQEYCKWLAEQGMGY